MDVLMDLNQKPFDVTAESLGMYYKALIKAGFTARQAFRLTEQYSKYVLEVTMEATLNRGFNDPSDLDPPTA